MERDFVLLVLNIVQLAKEGKNESDLNSDQYKQTNNGQENVFPMNRVDPQNHL